MTKILDDLRQDHRNLALLWDLLGRELNIFKEGGHPDYELVETILDYCLNYPDLCHHPKENLVYDKLAERDPGAISAIGDLKKEHEKLTSLTWRFSTALSNVLEDEQLPREWFLNVANDFLGFSRNHMQMEEVLFFPAARKGLTGDDWAELEKAVEDVEDPLFGSDKQEKYQSLFQDIMDWKDMLEKMDADETRTKTSQPS
ncbi:MAG: hemerythrin domain-containing protein [Alphaproteobacteria bacterium]|nr:hemerythrin domain-containing protein [Alphaproteobacteria bacterium]